MRRRAGQPHSLQVAVLVLLTGLCILTAGCSEGPLDVPSVVHLGLDEAKNTLTRAGAQKIKVVDAVEERAVWQESNWVVVAQEPVDVTVPPTTEITLRVAKPSDDRFLELVPADSAVAQQERERRAEEQQEHAEARAVEERKRAESAEKNLGVTKEYVDAIDPAARIGKAAIDELPRFAAAAEVSTEPDSAVIEYTTGFNNTMDTYKRLLDDVGNPDHLEDPTDRLKEAVVGFKKASQTLIALIGSDDAATMRRFRQLYDDNRTKYNAALGVIYAGTGVEAPFIAA
ncbi:PASTA domain-containing protein [Gordonia aurantiaca]|uniref:PASTA domain-containing protein n=1 Tax=Gordonia sp. B21 TaxID=3151852 RepID=UPI00326771BF